MGAGVGNNSLGHQPEHISVDQLWEISFYMIVALTLYLMNRLSSGDNTELAVAQPRFIILPTKTSDKSLPFWASRLFNKMTVLD